MARSAAEGIGCGLDFKTALKDSENSQLVKFQGSPQVGHHIRLVRLGACAGAGLARALLMIQLQTDTQL